MKTTMTAFDVNPQNGWLFPVIQRPSPHYDARPHGVAINMVVIHGISLPPGEFGSPVIEHFFCGEYEKLTHPTLTKLKKMTVSAHLLIKRCGEVVQFVPFTQRAWHAGESFFAGEKCCNDFSVGIELEGTDIIPYTSLQYDHLSHVIKALMHHYPAITKDRIVGHSDIAPHRKTDPGPAFDWSYLREKLCVS